MNWVEMSKDEENIISSPPTQLIVLSGGSKNFQECVSVILAISPTNAVKKN